MGSRTLESSRIGSFVNTASGGAAFNNANNPVWCLAANNRGDSGPVNGDISRTRGGRRHSTAGGRRRGGRWRHTFAALDLGTNNCRLLVARPARDGFHVIDSFSRIVRLGQGLAATGVLGDDAIERTIEALKVCAGKMRRRRVTLSRSVATEACRQAGNCDEFLTRVTEQTGIGLDIIDAAEEARLAVAGCAPLLDQGCENALVFDIGGGSTEVMWLRVCADTGPEVLAWTSLPCGVVRVV